MTEFAGFNGSPRLRGNAGIDWSVGRADFGWNMEYYGRSPARFSGGTAQSDAQQMQLQGGAYVPSQSYHDIYASYTFDTERQNLLSGTKLRLGIENVLDEMPPYSAFGLIGYSQLGDPRLRRFTFTVARSFGQ